MFVICAATAIAAPAQTLTTLHSFDNTDGYAPVAGLVQATNGDLYGTTWFGGANVNCVLNGVTTGCGTVFKITPSGTLTTLYSFCSQSGCTDGEAPASGLVQASDGDFYGTTYNGGTGSACTQPPGGCGTVFKITPSGTLTTLHSFDATDGAYPNGPLVQATDGDLYGTTSLGGASFNCFYFGIDGCGTVFKITPSGTLTTLYSFCVQLPCADGTQPAAGVVQATNGDLYGTTLGDTVFKITLSGTLTTLYNFLCSQSSCPNGSEVMAALVQATNGNLYGTTFVGGANLADCFGFGCGTVFAITPGGTLTTLHSFDGTDGGNPEAALIQATDGNLYGATGSGGANGAGGTIFKITSNGTLTTLYNFCSQSDCTDGSGPMAALVQDTRGNFYGTTWMGGAGSSCMSSCGYGTVFSLSVGLGPFVKTLPGAGKVGQEVGILGTNLTGATSVTFNGTSATFTVKSSSLILTHVPTGATTGRIKVVTPSRTLSSNVPFHVIP